MNRIKRITALNLLAICLLPVQLYAQAGATLRADFDPSAGVVPNPINLLFTGSQDGTLNIPVDPSDPSAGPILALNALDGFSTIAPITATFSNGVLPIPGNPTPIVSAIDPATVVAGSTVRVFEVDLVNPFLGEAGDPFTVTGVQRELTPNMDYIASLSPLDPSGTTVVIVPLRPLAPKTGHMVVFTDGIRAALDGSPAFPDQTYIFARYRREPLIDEAGASEFPALSDAQAQALEPIRRIVVSQEDAAAGAGVPRGSIILSWTFLTQSTTDVLAAVRANAGPQPAGLVPTGTVTPLGTGDIFAGTIQLPYFLEAPSVDPTVILRTRWRGVNSSEVTRYNPQPVATQTVTVPLLASIPNTSAKPAGGWPIVIFQHGITVNRTVMLGVADALAAAGFAVFAIDLPLHGITDPTNPLYNGPAERTFNVDLIDNTTGAPGPDSVIDSSGAHAINLLSLLTSRDNLRQAVVDLFHLTATAPTVDIDGDGAPDFDGTQIRFVGHSLGGIVGVPYLTLEPNVSSASLPNAGGGLAQLLAGSPNIGPRIEAGLAAAGIVPGSPEFASFLGAFQTALDSGDPINYAITAADLHPIHITEIVGSDISPPDQTVPNNVPGAPLSGTEALARIMGLASIDSTTMDANGIRGIVRITEGNHSSFLSPTAPPLDLASPAATAEMQSETASFAASAGTTLIVSNPAVIQPAPAP